MTGTGDADQGAPTRWWGSLVRIDSPDAEVRRRGAAAAVVMLGILAVGLVAMLALALLPDTSRVPLAITSGVWLVAVVCYALVRRGRVSLGIWLLLVMITVGNILSPWLQDDFALTPVYLAIPAAIGAAMLPLRQSRWVILGSVALAVAAIPLAGGATTTTLPAREVVVAAVIIILATSVAALLGVTGQQRALDRSDALARELAVANRDLEERVAERTRDLTFALDRQEQLTAELAEQSVRDPLTDVYNRRFADEELDRLVSRAARSGRPLSVAMVDLDHFKAVNDTLGHAAGDVVLRRVADAIVDETRRGDTVVRWGGEEFALLMPDTDLAAAVDVAERVRVRIERRGVDLRTEDGADRGGTVRVTVSAGVAVWPDPGAPPERSPDGSADPIDPADLVADADRRMYEAKRSGRNRVVPAAAALPSLGELLGEDDDREDDDREDDGRAAEPDGRAARD